MFFTSTWGTVSAPRPTLSRSKSACEIPNSPIRAGISLIPFCSGDIASKSGKGSRGALVKGSVPSIARQTPKAPVNTPFDRFFEAMEAITERPRSARANFSAGPKASVAFASKGANRARMTRLRIPPMSDATTAPPSANPPSPFWLMRNPSSAVARAFGLPGIPRRMAGIEAPDTAPVYTARSRAIPVAVGR